MSNQMDDLTELWRTKAIDAATFTQMAKELRQAEQLARPPQEPAAAAAEEEPADDEEDDLMVDEDGNPYKQPRPDSPQPSDASNRSGCDQPLGYELDGDDDLQQGSDEGSSVHSSPRPRTPQVSEEPGGPETWATNTKVISSELTDFDVYFIRLGNAADFVNSNRAKITYSKVMDGRKRKKEIKERWVLPGTLKLPPPGEAEETIASPDESGRRTSPRIAERRMGRGGETGSAGPELAAHERVRKLPQKQPSETPYGSKAVSEYKTKESEKTVEQRIAEFPNHSLCKNPMNQNLRCAACSKDIRNKCSTITDHTRLETRPGQPSQHALKLKAWLERGGEDAVTKANLVAYYRDHPNEHVPATEADELLYRYRVAEAFVARPPFERIDDYRPLLQRSGRALTASTNLKAFIPKIEASELELVDSELREQYLSIAFDGTTRLGEAINTTCRWCTVDFKIQKRLIDFTTLKKHVDAPGLAVHVTNVVMQKRRVPSHFLVNIARDSASVNGAAYRRMALTFTNAAGTLCLCHVLCGGGERFELLTLNEFKTPWLQLAGGRDPHRGAQALWKQMVDVVVPGYSNVRWYSWAEILFVIAKAGMKLLGDFITECERLDYGDATTKSLRKIYNEKPAALRLELAAMLDMEILVKTTYELEGDRLEVLLVFHRVEILRALGRALHAKEEVLPNVDAALRRLMPLKPGVKTQKFFHGHGICDAKLQKIEKVGSTLYPGKEVDAWVVKYDSDGLIEHIEVEELRSGKQGAVPNGQDGKPYLVVRDLPERDAIIKALLPAFNYLEQRITGTCDAQYSLVEMYALCRAVRAFDPAFAHIHVDSAFVDTMSAITPLHGLGMLANLKLELPQYRAAAASAPTFDKASVADYSDSILSWWRANGSAFPAWALAARIVFAISPNSASCERVFSLLKNLFGEQQMAALADYVQAALMLNYNGRNVG